MMPSEELHDMEMISEIKGAVSSSVMSFASIAAQVKE